MDTQFGYVDSRQREDFKMEYILDGSLLTGYTLESESDSENHTFSTMEEVVAFTKTLKGKIKISDCTTDSNIFLKDGICIWYEDMWNHNDEYNARVWRGIILEKNDDIDEGMRRLSVYDVYSERELL